MHDFNTPVFTLAEAHTKGLSKDRIYQLLADGKIERASRGIYMYPDRIDPLLAPLATATAARSQAIMCLTSALSYHNLIDTMPFGCDIALPRGTRKPVSIKNTIWHSFDKATFDIGRIELPNKAELDLYVYSQERCLIDAFRLAHLEGKDTATGALKRWLALSGNSPASLLKMARSFPKAEPSLRHALEVLL